MRGRGIRREVISNHPHTMRSNVPTPFREVHDIQFAAVPVEPVTAKQISLREMRLMKDQIEQHYSTAVAFITCSDDNNVINGIVKAFKNTVGTLCSVTWPVVS